MKEGRKGDEVRNSGRLEGRNVRAASEIFLVRSKSQLSPPPKNGLAFLWIFDRQCKTKLVLDGHTFKNIEITRKLFFLG
jgi:hypothetical protein